MKRIEFLACGLLTVAGVPGMAQEGMGWTTVELVDAVRDNRVIECAVWYPAAANGEDSEPAGGPFPALVMAHGFAMSSMDYEALAAGFVAEGFAFLSLGTEQGLAPDHEDFGLDLAFVANAANSNDELMGLLSGEFNGRVGIMGHSMGGGASWLAAATGPSIDAVVALAPAETNPSAIAAGPEIDVPVLVVSGALDAVTPPVSQHHPIYESALNAPCRALVTIMNGGHCGFADAGTLCDIAELGFQGLSHAEQQALTLSVSIPWLNAFLQDDASGLDALEAAGNEAGMELQLSCELGVGADIHQHFSVYPNPGRGQVFIRNNFDAPMIFEVWNGRGQLEKECRVAALSATQQCLSPGFYLIVPKGLRGKVPPTKALVY